MIKRSSVYQKMVVAVFLLQVAIAMNKNPEQNQKPSQNKIQADTEWTEEELEEFAARLDAFILENPDFFKDKKDEESEKQQQERKKEAAAKAKELEKLEKEIAAAAKDEPEVQTEAIKAVTMFDDANVAQALEGSEEKANFMTNEYTHHTNKGLYYTHLCKAVSKDKPTTQYLDQSLMLMYTSTTLFKACTTFLHPVPNLAARYYLDANCNLYTWKMANLRVQNCLDLAKGLSQDLELQAYAAEVEKLEATKHTKKTIGGFTLNPDYQLYFDKDCNWATLELATAGKSAEKSKTGAFTINSSVAHEVQVGSKKVTFTATTQPGIWVDKATCNLFTSEEATLLGCAKCMA